MNTHIDMADFIAPKSDQLNSDDLMGGPRTITITGVKANEGSSEQPISIFFEGDGGKPYKPCKTMRRLMVAVWKRDTSKYIGRSMTLYRDEKVQFGGMDVGGIRISHMSDIEGRRTVSLTAAKARKAVWTVEPLAAGKGSAVDGMLSAIEACKSQSELRAWWKANGNTIPDQIYERVFAAFNDRLAAVKSAPPATAATDPKEGPADSQMGETHNDATAEETAERLVREIRGIELLADVASYEGRQEFKDAYATLPEAWADKVDEAIAAQRQKLGGK